MPGRSRPGSKSGPADVNTAASQPSARAARAAYAAVPPSTSPPSRRSQVTCPTASRRGTALYSSGPLGPGLLEQGELPVLGLRHGHRVAAREAGGAVAVPLGVANGLEQARVGQVAQGVGADVAADLLDAVVRGDQLALQGRVDAVVAGARGGRAADPHVDLAGPG